MFKEFFLAGLLASLMICAGTAFGQAAEEADSMLVSYYVIKGGDLGAERAGIWGTDGIKDGGTKTLLIGLTGKGVYMQSTVLWPGEKDFKEEEYQENQVVAIYEMREIVNPEYDATFRAWVYVTKMKEDGSVENCRIENITLKIEYGKEFLISVGPVGIYPELSLAFKIFSSADWKG